MIIHDLLEQIEKCVSSKLHHVALFTALTIPDIAGAVDSVDGRANGQKYAQWFDAHVAPKYYAFGTQYLTGADCYQFRCVMLHQGRAKHTNGRYSKPLLLVAKQQNIAYCGAFTLDGGRTLGVDIPLFCNNIVEAAYDWVEKVEHTKRFKKNSAEFMELFTLSFEE